MITKATTILGIEKPIIQGGMGNISNAALSAAISNAGGLGTIGAGTMSSDTVERMIKEVKERTDKPFALNIALSVHPEVERLMELVEHYDIPAVSLSAGNPAPYIPQLSKRGRTVICVVGTVRQAVKAEQAGAALIVAEGVEAAGLNSPQETTTLTLVPQVADAVSVPVLAAGGIADGRGLLAVLALGAEGVQMGTRFIAVKEAPFSEYYKQRILQADDSSTIIIGRSVGRIRRVLDGPYARLLKDSEPGLSLEQYSLATDERRHCLGALEGKDSEGFMNSGQIAGLIRDLPSVSELLDEMVAECEKGMERLYAIKSLR